MLMNAKNRDWQLAYLKQYPGEECAFGEPANNVLIAKSEDSDICVIEPKGETVEAFMNRLKRSKEEGRNLFYEEWPTFKYEDGVAY